MKLIALALISTMTMADVAEETEMPTIDFVKNTYAYCKDIVEDTEHTDSAILNCINEDLISADYKTFTSLKAVEDFINQQ